MEKIRATQKQIRFLLNIQRLLAEGQFTATYKFALLLAIADISVERGHDDDRELTIRVEEIAEKFIEYYWGHTMPFKRHVLKAATGKQATVITILTGEQERYSLVSALKRSNNWRRVVKAIAKTIKDQPLWKLQTVPGRRDDFLYPNTGKGDSITLRRGVCYSFRLFYGLITELVRSNWLEFVRRNRENQGIIGQHGDLEQFLFGGDRASLQIYKEPLIKLQEGRCFYCRKHLPNECEVDHFIPWSIYKHDLGHNFVVADKGCNSDKSSRLAGIEHLKRWTRRNLETGDRLAADFTGLNINHDLLTSLKVAEHAYRHAEISDASLWVRKKGIVEPIGENWRRILSLTSGN